MGKGLVGVYGRVVEVCFILSAMTGNLLGNKGIAPNFRNPNSPARLLSMRGT